jgi:hypothetical protein
MSLLEPCDNSLDTHRRMDYRGRALWRLIVVRARAQIVARCGCARGNGTGFSSLGRLYELPIDTLKIDRMFTSRLPAVASGVTAPRSSPTGPCKRL